MVTYYKSIRFIDGKLKRIIVDENDNVIQNPTNEQIKIAKQEDRYSHGKDIYKDRVCCECGSNDTARGYSGPLWHSHKCDKKYCTGYLCNKCNTYLYTYGTLDRDLVEKKKKEFLKIKRENKTKGRKCCVCGKSDTYERPDGYRIWLCCTCGKEDCTKHMCANCYGTGPDSNANLIKRMRRIRTDGIEIYTTTAKGIIGESVLAKTRNLDVLAIRFDNFKLRLDLSPDPKYGIIQSKLKTKDIYYGWNVYIGYEHNFDNLVVLCASIDTKIDRVYIIPVSELYGKYQIYISESMSKWEKFRVYEQEKNNYDKNFQSLMSYLGEKFTIEDIKKWLKGYTE